MNSRAFFVLVLLSILATLSGCDSGDSVNAVDDSTRQDGTVLLPARHGTVEITRDHDGVVSRMKRGDRVLFEIGARFGDAGFTVFESSPQDELELTIVIDDDHVVETYQINGETLTLRYPAVDRKAFAHSYHRWQAGETVGLNAELVTAFEEFVDFYTANYPASLHDNAAGEELVFVTGKHGDGLRRTCGQPCQRYVSYFCSVMSIGTGIKCLFGGPANVICDVGAVVSIACSLWTLFTVVY